MTYIADLEASRDNIASVLKTITASPKPSYAINGQTVSWSQYMKELSESLQRLNKLIAEGEVDEEPFEVSSQGMT